MPEEDLPSLPHDIQAPEDYLPGTPIWIWVVLIIIALALLIGIVLLIRFLIQKTSPSALSSSQDLFQGANEQLSNLAPKSGTIPLALFATKVSLILRDCLSKVLHDPALYETDEELALRSASLDSVPLSMHAILEKLATAKYAPSFINEEQAKGFIEQATGALRDFQRSQGQTGEERES